jgi:hypothetical protein
MELLSVAISITGLNIYFADPYYPGNAVLTKIKIPPQGYEFHSREYKEL